MNNKLKYIIDNYQYCNINRIDDIIRQINIDKIKDQLDIDAGYFYEIFGDLLKTDFDYYRHIYNILINKIFENEENIKFYSQYRQLSDFRLDNYALWGNQIVLLFTFRVLYILGRNFKSAYSQACDHVDKYIKIDKKEYIIPELADFKFSIDNENKISFSDEKFLKYINQIIYDLNSYQQQLIKLSEQTEEL